MRYLGLNRVENLLGWSPAARARWAAAVVAACLSAGLLPVPTHAQGNEAGEPVVINDWTHQYYLRGLDPAPSYEAPAAPGRRCWVLISAYDRPASYRLEVARGLAPPGWELESHSEAHLATVVSFVPPRLSRGGLAP